MSESRRAAVNEWYENTLLSRLTSKHNGVIVLVMQRLHQDDLVGHVLDRGEEWEVLSFPAIAEEDEQRTIQTALGPFLYERKVGDVLDSDRESLQALLAMKQVIGEYNFTSQYQQNPTPAGGAVVKSEWLREYDENDPPRFTYMLQSWDTANKSGELNDYSVCTTWGYRNSRFYLLDVLRERLDYPQLKRAVLSQMQKYHPQQVIIEDRRPELS